MSCVCFLYLVRLRLIANFLRKVGEGIGLVRHSVQFFETFSIFHDDVFFLNSQFFIFWHSICHFSFSDCCSSLESSFYRDRCAMCHSRKGDKETAATAQLLPMHQRHCHFALASTSEGRSRHRTHPDSSC